jgi:hypothetical protein
MSNDGIRGSDWNDTDTLWGVERIARYIGKNKRTTYYLLQNDRLPHRKFGPRIICASRRELDRALGRTTEEKAASRVHLAEKGPAR